MMRSKSELPQSSMLYSPENNYDYVDSFQGVFMDRKGDITATDIGKYFFKSGPKWIDRLFAWRNKLAGALGLKTPGKIADRQKMLENFKTEKGEQLGLFKVFDKTSNEIVLGEDDRHLNFRVSLLIDKPATENTGTKLITSTTVKFHNWWDRLYFLPVRPFHQLIVPAILKGMIQNIEQHNGSF